MNQLSKEKAFAFEVMDMFDELMRPELKTKWAAKIWGLIPGFVKGRIQKKPDKEINDKMVQIYMKFKNHFKDLDFSAEVQAFERLNDIKIPKVGEIKEKSQVIELTEKQADQILKELNL